MRSSLFSGGAAEKYLYRSKQSGATMAEYALVLALLIFIVILGLQKLEIVGNQRRDKSIAATDGNAGMSPCGAGLSGIECR